MTAQPHANPNFDSCCFNSPLAVATIIHDTLITRYGKAFISRRELACDCNSLDGVDGLLFAWLREDAYRRTLPDAEQLLANFELWVRQAIARKIIDRMRKRGLVPRCGECLLPLAGEHGDNGFACNGHLVNILSVVWLPQKEIIKDGKTS